MRFVSKNLSERGEKEMYDIVIVREVEEDDTKENSRKKCIQLKCGTRKKNQEMDFSYYTDIIILELEREQSLLTLHICGQEGSQQLIHTKKIVLTTYTKISDSNIISIYEVLWAAQVKLDPISLEPITSCYMETSIPNLFYDKHMA